MTEDGANILVVDDDYDVCHLMAEILEERGFLTAMASNGAEALAALQGGLRPRLILLDLMMPVMDGEAFCRTIRADPEFKDLPVVIVSADVAAPEKTASCGATALLKKPIQLETLLETAERYAGSGRPLPE